MKKQEFLSKLKDRLCRLPPKEVEERVNFYAEMIDDRIEDGLSEEQAVEQLGNFEDVVCQIIAEIPLTKIVKEKIKTKEKLSGWGVLILSVGSPIWFSLIVSALAVAFSLYACLWSLVVCAWATVVSFCAGVVGGVLGGILFMFTANLYSGIFLIACGITCVGLSIFSYYGCIWVVKVTLKLTKRILFGIKKCFVKKEVA